MRREASPRRTRCASVRPCHTDSMGDADAVLTAAATLDEKSLRSTLAHIMDRQVCAQVAAHSQDHPVAALAIRGKMMEFQSEALKAVDSALAARDTSLLDVIVSLPAPLAAMGRADALGLLPRPLEWRHLLIRDALAALANALDDSRCARQYELMQRLMREIVTGDARVDHWRSQHPQPFVPPAGEGSSSGAPPPLLRAADVQRLRAGEALILQPKLDITSPERMQRVHADLLKVIQSLSIPSQSPCNYGSLSTSLPLPHIRGGSGGMMSGLCLSSETQDVLRLLCALPAEIEKHGWPRKLTVPPMCQLASYAADSGARCERSPRRPECDAKRTHTPYYRYLPSRSHTLQSPLICAVASYSVCFAWRPPLVLNPSQTRPTWTGGSMNPSSRASSPSSSTPILDGTLASTAAPCGCTPRTQLLRPFPRSATAGGRLGLHRHHRHQ